MKSERLKPAVEPVLKIHRYVVRISYPKRDGKMHTKFHYCVNRTEVRQLKAKQKSVCIFAVFKAEHNFTSGWLIK